MDHLPLGANLVSKDLGFVDSSVSIFILSDNLVFFAKNDKKIEKMLVVTRLHSFFILTRVKVGEENVLFVRRPR